MKFSKKQAFDGTADLLEAIHELKYRSAAHAVLARSVFPPPSIVEEVGFNPIVNAVRRGKFPGLGNINRDQYISPVDVSRLFGLSATAPAAKGVLIDDNACPDFALRACFTRGRHQASTQLAHVFPSKYSKHPLFFTSLPNLVLVPSWLARLTDTDPAVCQTLRWAVRTVYGFCPVLLSSRGSPSIIHSCTVCEKPAGDCLNEEEIRCLIAQYECYRSKDYRKAALGITRNSRWRKAIEAGTGYDYPLLRPSA